MPRVTLTFIAAALLSLALINSAHAQTQNPGCSPPPGTANLIVCLGNTPCPPGYVDPVGLRTRQQSQNPLAPDSTKWLCQLPAASQDQSPSNSGTASATIPDIAGSAVRVTAPVLALITTTVGIDVKPGVGPYLTSPQHMALYTLSKDSDGVSTCANACAIIWLALHPASGNLTLPDGATGALGVSSRADGTQQVTYNGMPLYLYTGDFQPGDTNGQGLAGLYQLATP